MSTAAENLLADFLREIRDIANVNKKRKERLEAKRLTEKLENDRFAALNLATNGRQQDGTITENGALLTATDSGYFTVSPVREKHDVEIVDERDTGGG